MAVNTPDSASQVEDRIKADVQREAPDSNPYLTVHWLRSLIAGIARRIFDFYRDLNRVERRLFPDTADDETAPQWGNIYVGVKNPATAASGTVVATGNPGGLIGIGVTMVANGIEYTTTTSGTIAANVLSVASITRSGTIATVTTTTEHGLSSFVPVTIAGADQTQYNVTDAAIVITGLTTFEYTVVGSPATPATGTITATATTANVNVVASEFSFDTNLARDTALTLQSPIVDVDNTLYVIYSEIGGGTDEESTAEYKSRYLEKIRNPVAHFNDADIIAEAKKVPGVTRVFVQGSGTEIDQVQVTLLERFGTSARAVTGVAHGFETGGVTSLNGADQPEYNVQNVPILVESDFAFVYLISGTPATPATGTIFTASTIPLGQVRVYFMRDNDDDPIPSAGEVATVKAQLDTIRPATTSSANLIVAAPTGVPTNFTFTALSPDTPTMRLAIEANINQFFAERTNVGVDVDEDQYRSAIINTVDPDTGDLVDTFTLSTPTGDVAIDNGEIAIAGVVSFP